MSIMDLGHPKAISDTIRPCYSNFNDQKHTLNFPQQNVLPEGHFRHFSAAHKTQRDHHLMSRLCTVTQTGLDFMNMKYLLSNLENMVAMGLQSQKREKMHFFEKNHDFIRVLRQNREGRAKMT